MQDLQSYLVITCNDIVWNQKRGCSALGATRCKKKPQTKTHNLWNPTPCSFFAKTWPYRWASVPRPVRSQPPPHELTSLMPCPVSRTAGGNQASFQRRKQRRHTAHSQKRLRPQHQLDRCTMG